MYNNVTLMGRLTDKADAKKIGDKTRATFTLAVSRNYKAKDGNYEADFIPVECWGIVADFVASHLDKGDLIVASGPLYVHKYEDKQGQKRTWLAVRAEEVHLAYTKRKNDKKQDNPSDDDDMYLLF